MRFIVFGGECYYASGGANDFICAWNDFDEACEAARMILGTPREQFIDIEWVHVFDVERRKIVARSKSTPHNSDQRDEIEPMTIIASTYTV